MAHRASAVVLGLFAVVHLLNHIWGLGGVAAHVAFMDGARMVYRSPIGEAILLTSVAAQAASGVGMMWQTRARKPRGFMRAQRLTGTYLAFFLIVHTSAVLIGRLGFKVDTNFYFGAATLVIPPLALFFAPYYFLAVVALFVHIAAAGRLWLSRNRLREPVARGMVVAGILIGALIIAIFSGAFFPITLPAEITRMYAFAR